MITLITVKTRDGHIRLQKRFGKYSDIVASEMATTNYFQQASQTFYVS
jgi:hypothetical protein